MLKRVLRNRWFSLGWRGGFEGLTTLIFFPTEITEIKIEITEGVPAEGADKKLTCAEIVCSLIR